MKNFIAAATILTLTGTAMHAKQDEVGTSDAPVEVTSETNMISNNQLGAGALLLFGFGLVLGNDDDTTTTTTTTTDAM